MPTYVKGNAVPHAVSYTLYKRNGAEYAPIVTKLSGKRKSSIFRRGEGIDYRGNVTVVTDPDIHVCRTNMINVSDLADDENGVCALIMPLEADVTSNFGALCFYSKENDFSSAVQVIPYNDIGYYVGNFTAENFKAKAKEWGAKYVAFCSNSDNEDVNFVNFHTDINIKLDDIESTLLPEGQSHSLVVEADGDGIEYEDSYYSNEVVWNRPVTPI